jgi:hypothetical protein
MRTGPFWMRSESRIMTRPLSVRGLAQLIIVALPLAMGVLIAHRSVDVPYWDEWEWADLVYKMHMGTLQFADLWAQHAEHRMLFTNLLMLGLARLGGWDPVREAFLSLGLLVLTQIAIVAMIRRTTRSSLGALLSIAASLLLYGIWQWENLGWGFQLGSFICNASALWVTFLLARTGRRPVHLVLAISLAVIGSYSVSQGLIVWAVGAVAMFLTGRQRGPALAVWMCAAIATFYIYRHGMIPVDVGHANVLAHPVVAAEYVLAYLGAPLLAWLGSRGSEAGGLFVLVALGTSFIADIRSSAARYRFARDGRWYALAAYPVLCAIITCVGRAGFGVDQALASRYTTIGGLAWIALIGLLASHARAVPRESMMRNAELLLIGATAFGVLIGASNFAAWGNWKATAQLLASARAELAVNDPAALTKIYPDRNRVIMLIGEMRSVHDGIFAGH